MTDRRSTDSRRDGPAAVTDLAGFPRDRRSGLRSAAAAPAVLCPVYLAACRQGCGTTPSPDCRDLLERCRRDAAAAGTTLDELRASGRFEEWVFETAASNMGGWG